MPAGWQVAMPRIGLTVRIALMAPLFGIAVAQAAYYGEEGRGKEAWPGG